jgi:prepilin-type N-terminal cleavage/methylation domain-containing protein
MKKDIKGFTLIELIIVIALITIISAGVVGIVIFSTDFFKSEDSDIIRQENVRIVTVNFEKDVRKSNQEVVEIDGCINVNAVEYCLTNNAIYRDGIQLAHSISLFEIDLAVDGSFLDLLVVSTPNNEGDEVSTETRIYLRKGD